MDALAAGVEALRDDPPRRLLQTVFDGVVFPAAVEFEHEVRPALRLPGVVAPPYGLYLYLGVVLFSLYIVYDVSMICNKLGYDDYVVAALELYLEIINRCVVCVSLLLAGRHPS